MICMGRIIEPTSSRKLAVDLFLFLSLKYVKTIPSSWAVILEVQALSNEDVDPVITLLVSSDSTCTEFCQVCYVLLLKWHSAPVLLLFPKEPEDLGPEIVVFAAAGFSLCNAAL